MRTCADRAGAATAVAMRVQEHTRIVRLGIVGCGMVGEHWHIPAALAVPDVDLVALADANSGRLERIAGSLERPCFTTASAMDLAGRVDAVSICLPNHLHYPIASEFLRAGVHVLCEKPLANTAAEARRLCELAEERGLVLAVGYVKRFEPNHRLMTQLLEEGLAGQLDRFEYEYGTAGGWAPLSNYNLLRHQAGGGVLMTNGCHLLDRIIDWFGYPSHVQFSDDTHGGVEANCSATFVFRSGLTGVVRLSKTHRLRNVFELRGDRGRILIAEAQRSSVTFFPAGNTGVQHEITPWPPPGSSSDADCFRLQMQDFLEAIQRGSEPRAGGRAGLSSIELVEECYRVRTPLSEPWADASVPRAASGRGAAAPWDRNRLERQDRNAVLVTGGNGFVGSRLCEVLHTGTMYRVRPFVRSSGRAAYIARHPLDFRMGDITNFREVREAMEGCSSVVHLARGSRDAMVDGLKNVLRAAVQARVRRFVHVSSVAVYGDNPPPAARDETAVAGRTGNPYGDLKLEQEHLVAQYGRKFGLPFVILRPPHIHGPGSHFVQAVVERLGSGHLPIVDGGNNICNLVYVDNLIEAVLLSLEKPEAVGETFFVTDRDRVTWRTCLEDFAGTLGVDAPVASSDQLELASRPTVSASLVRLSRVLLSDEFRSAAKDLPGAGVVASMLHRAYAALPEGRRRLIRSRVKTPLLVHQQARHPRYDAADYLIVSQRRTVVHSCEKAERILGYTAPVSYRDAIRLTSAWMQFAQLI